MDTATASFVPGAFSQINCCTAREFGRLICHIGWNPRSKTYICKWATLRNLNSTISIQKASFSIGKLSVYTCN